MAKKSEKNKKEALRSLWEEPPKESSFFSPAREKPRRSGWFYFFAAGGIAVLGTGTFYLLRGAGKPNVSLEFSKPDQVLVGQPFTLNISFSNYSSGVLKNAKLSVLLPDDVLLLGQPPEQRAREQSLGDLGPGSLSQQGINLIATGGSQTLKRVKAKLTYAAPENERVQFESSADIDIAIGEPAVTLSFTTPENVVSGEDLEFTVKYTNNTNEDFKNLAVRIDYPPIFRFKKSSVEPTTGSNYWDLGTLTRGSEGSFTVSGSVVGPERSVFSLGGSLLGSFLGQTYTVSAETASVGIAVAPLSLSVSAPSVRDGAARLGESVHYVFAYRNNSGVALENVSIQAKLVGELLDFSGLTTAASFNPTTKTFLWSASSVPELASVAPGTEGSVALDVKVADRFPVRRLSDKNYTLGVQAQVESPTKAADNSLRTLSVANLETKVAGQIAVRAAGYFRDAPSGILNSGPYPPKAGTATDFTIHWSIQNYATDASNVKVSAFLEPGVKFTGTVKSAVESQPIFDKETNSVIWQIGGIPATRGVVGEPLEAVFQVEATPAPGQVGQDVPLIKETMIRAQDSFTGLELSSSAGPVTSAVPDDTTIEGDRHVQAP